MHNVGWAGKMIGGCGGGAPAPRKTKKCYTPQVMSILQTIRQQKHTEVAALRQQGQRAPEPAEAKPARPFRAALQTAAQNRDLALIAECKRASPSAGTLRDPYDPADLAQTYAAVGAAALSILTDTRFFHGDPSHLRAARAACSLPVLRKDFLLDPLQIAESRAMGADCILLILALLEDAPLARELEAAAHEAGMEVLIETHNEAEMERALAMRSPLIGINNRDLSTFKTDIDTTRRLARLVPATHTIISESGIADPADIARLRDWGVSCVLVGESLMRAPDIIAAVKRLFPTPAP